MRKVLNNVNLFLWESLSWIMRGLQERILHSHQYPTCIALRPIRATSPAHLILLNLIILIKLSDE
jgi:hypothetical protein